jgi:hypothetical protein
MLSFFNLGIKQFIFFKGFKMGYSYITSSVYNNINYLVYSVKLFFTFLIKKLFRII